jgi:hypothetical protein
MTPRYNLGLIQPFVLVMLLSMVSACSTGPLSHKEMQAYVSDADNGLLGSTTVGRTQIEVRFKPTHLLVHAEVSGENVTRVVLDSLRRKYGMYYYFTLSFSTGGRESLYEQEGGILNIVTYWRSFLLECRFRDADNGDPRYHRNYRFCARPHPWYGRINRYNFCI